jgi:restriction endonuclease S subunit
MHDSWVIKHLYEVCTKFGAGPFGSNMKVSTFVDTGIPVVSGNHMTELELVEKSFNYITEDHANRMQSSIVQRNDVVITKAGTIGQVSLIPENSRFSKYILSSRQLFVRPNPEQVLPKYLAIYLKYGRGQDQILSNVNRTGVPSLSQAVSFIKNVRIELPPLPEQKRIVDLISSVDSYIEALQQQLECAKRSRNAVLHELLTAGGDDWVETTLGHVCDFVNGDRGKNYPSAKFRQSHGIPFINAGHLGDGIVNFDSMDFISEEVFKKLGGGKIQPGDTLFCLRGSVGKFANVGELDKGAIASSLVIIRPSSRVTKDFLMLYLDSDLCSSELKQSLTGAVQPNLSANNLKNFKISLPDINSQIEIGNLLGQFKVSIASLGLMIESAKNLRAGLLSDLLSGEHEIPASYDKEIGAA